MNTHIRASSPNNLARIGLKYLNGYGDYYPALWLCTGCRECEYNCPISNSLWEALRITRGQRVQKETINLEEKFLGGSGSSLLLVSSNTLRRDTIESLKKLYKVYWLDSNPLYTAYWNGFDIQLNIDKFDFVVLEDLDIASVIGSDWGDKVIYSIQLLDMLGYRNIVGNREYLLHIPCKVPIKNRQLLADVSTRVLGEPINIVDKCIGGGGGLPEKHPEIAVEVIDLSLKGYGKDIPIITLCSRGRSHLLKSGYFARAPFDFIRGEM